jgi:hypothetical protein
MKIKKLCPKEDVFFVIFSHHLMKGHAGACTTWEAVKNTYSNISHDLSTKFVELCSCRVNQHLPNFPEEITPILTRKMKDRGQVDLVDMQGQQYHGYK